MILTVLLSLLFILETQAQTTHKVGTVTFDDDVTLYGQKAVYNGGAIRKKYFFKLYSIGLYLPAKTNNAQKAIDEDGFCAVRLIITSSMVTREKFIETVTEGFATSSEGKASKAEIDQLMSYFSEEFKEGDNILLAYKPDSGIEVWKNRKHLGSVKGLEFKKALFGIWLGKTPADADVKKGMLGN